MKSTASQCSLPEYDCVRVESGIKEGRAASFFQPHMQCLLQVTVHWDLAFRPDAALKDAVSLKQKAKTGSIHKYTPFLDFGENLHLQPFCYKYYKAFLTEISPACRYPYAPYFPLLIHRCCTDLGSLTCSTVANIL